MMTEMMPLGTIVQYKTSRAMIVGYTYVEKEQCMTLMYILIPWPTGFANPEDCRVAQPEQVTVIARGETPPEMSIILQYHSAIQKIIQDKPAAQVEDAWKALHHELIAEGEEKDA